MTYNFQICRGKQRNMIPFPQITQKTQPKQIKANRGEK